MSRSRGGFWPVTPSGWPRGKGYTDGMLSSRGGRVLFVAGQIGWDDKHRLVRGGFAPQFERALSNLVAVVRAAGGRPSDVGRLTIYVSKRREYLSAGRRVGDAYRRVMGRHFPAMTLVEVAGLLEPGAKVEIEGTAVVGRGR